mmetsp:Transcript_4045/g.16908  ORF Transcript_4045/g.16908 Transcript_4045/m.16908 type:complete len:242 (+) Transcript_4045:703-1428(+)
MMPSGSVLMSSSSPSSLKSLSDADDASLLEEIALTWPASAEAVLTLRVRRAARRSLPGPELLSVCSGAALPLGQHCFALSASSLAARFRSRRCALVICLKKARGANRHSRVAVTVMKPFRQNFAALLRPLLSTCETRKPSLRRYWGTPAPTRHSTRTAGSAIAAWRSTASESMLDTRLPRSTTESLPLLSLVRSSRSDTSRTVTWDVDRSVSASFLSMSKMPCSAGSSSVSGAALSIASVM